MDSHSGLSLYSVSLQRNGKVVKENFGVYAQSLNQYGAYLWYTVSLFHFWRKRAHDYRFLYRWSIDITISDSPPIFKTIQITGINCLLCFLLHFWCFVWFYSL